MAFDSALISAVQCMWISFLLANKYACYYKLAMVFGERCNIVSLSEKLEMQISKSGLCYERDTWFVIFFFIPRPPERTIKKKKRERECRNVHHIVRSCVCVHFQQGSQKVIITYLDRTILKKKHLNLFSYTLKKRFLFMMATAKADFLAKNPFTVFWRRSEPHI